MIEALRAILDAHPAVSYALLFGSAAKGTMHAGSDVDVAIGTAGARTSALEFGLLTSELEQAARRPVHLVLLDEAPPALAYHVFRDGIILVARDRPALVARRARAILEYLDFRPIEELLVAGVLRAAHGR